MKAMFVINKQGVPFNVRLAENDTIIKFYDARYIDKFGELGQFVSSYYVETIIDHDRGLCLDGGVYDWQVSEENMMEIIDWLKSLTS